MNTIFRVTVFFIDLVTKEKKGHGCFTREEDVDKMPKGSSIFLPVGDGKNTVFGEGNCEFEFEIRGCASAPKWRIVCLANVEFSDTFRGEFAKNWKEVKKE
ncbi:MAG TPA: hypothetical protein DIT25_02935 [Candidatus Moranbacteria bacterium]|nr:hypothetical protein [Candidatus Moranbacteria bacterium]